MLHNKKLIIFDMDGTLIDSIGIWNDVDCDLLQRLTGREHDPALVQKRRDETLRKYRQDPDPYLRYSEFLSELHQLSESGEEIVQIRYEIAAKHLTTRIDYKPGVPEILKELKSRGYDMVIASITKRKNMTVYRTENTNLMSKAPIDEYFKKYYTQEDVKETKPNPEIYLKVLADFGRKPEECLIFEDSLVGIEAANAAGVDVVAMYDKHSDRDRTKINLLSKYQFDDFFQVLDAIQ
ncbi:MAG: HAD family phosphatase [Firmicutes bacterium]|nr:HAD family phosphatase [Bacillota bacterium]